MECLNGNPKIKNYTCLFIRQLFKFCFFLPIYKKKGSFLGSQVVYTRSITYIVQSGLIRGKSHFTTFKPIILLEKAGFFTLSAMRDTLRSRERGIINTDNLNNFYEWFTGFTDAEVNFYIHIGTICAFRFQMNLHKDDINVLHYIQKSLFLGGGAS